MFLKTAVKMMVADLSSSWLGSWKVLGVPEMSAVSPQKTNKTAIHVNVKHPAKVLS
jgi:hypothetical protein